MSKGIPLSIMAHNEQDGGRLDVSIVAGEVQWSVALSVLRVNLGPVLQED